MRQSSHMRVDGPAHLLGGLLFVEVCLLCGMAGILAWRFPAPGLFCFFMVCWLDSPRGLFFSPGWGHALFLLLCFLAGMAWTGLAEPKAPTLPVWFEQSLPQTTPGRAALLGKLEKEAGHRPGAILVSARVEGCAPLPGKRLRVILTDIVPLSQDAREGATGRDRGFPGQAYTGRVVWTWSFFDPRKDSLLPGQYLELKLRFVPVRSFANPESWSPDRYWHDRSVFFRGLSSGKDRPVIRDPEKGRDSPFLRSVRHYLAEKRHELQQAYYAAMPGEGAAAAILPALVFGDRSLLTQARMDLFSRSTLAHSLALSGLHMGFAVLAGLMLAWGLGLLFPSLLLRLSRPGLALLCSLPFCLVYLWLGQYPISLLRAACMLFFWTLLFFMRRPKVLLDGLFAALAFILAVNPLALFDLGLQLSALCIAVLALCLPGIIAFSRKLFPDAATRGGSRSFFSLSRVLQGAFIIFCSSLCIQIALLPLTVRAFGSSGVLFPLNLFWLPVLGTLVLPLCFLGLLSAALGLESMASLLLHAAALPCDGLVALLEFLDKAGLLFSPLLPRPNWISAAGYWLLCLAVPFFAAKTWRRWIRDRDAGDDNAEGPAPASMRLEKNGVAIEKGAAGREAGCVRRLARYYGSLLAPVALGLFLLFLPPCLVMWRNNQTAVQLKLLDVGQGQSVLVEWSGLGAERSSGRALIDGGGFASDHFDVGKAVVAPVLTYTRLPRLDVVINSHPDRDHLGGLLFILENFAVGRYYGNGDEPSPKLADEHARATAKSGLLPETLAAGDVLELGPGLRLEVLWPMNGTAESGFSDGGNEEAGRGGRRESRNRNDNSLILRLVWQGRGLALIPGDAGRNPLRYLARKDGPDLSSQVLVLPHHGSGKSLAPSLYKKVKPEMALAACGSFNSWGYPAASIVKSLREMGVDVYSTGERGQIAVRWTAPEELPAMSFALPGP